MIMKTIKITPNTQGYIWMSDEAKPSMELKDFELDENKNPFVIESQLFDGEVSTSIRFIDGHYVVKEYKLSAMENEYTEHTYLSHRMDGKKLLFRKYWKPVPDEFCCNMPVLKPAEILFVGFKDEEDKK